MLRLLASSHAVQRARQRLGWSRSALLRMLERVVYAGLGPADCGGALRLYLLAATEPEEDVLLRVYGVHVFVLTRDEAETLTLKTVFPLPPELRPFATRARRYYTEITPPFGRIAAAARKRAPALVTRFAYDPERAATPLTISALPRSVAA